MHEVYTMGAGEGFEPEQGTARKTHASESLDCGLHDSKLLVMVAVTDTASKKQ